MTSIKLRLKNGSREIELEGSVKDVEDLLQKWWSPLELNADGEQEQAPLRQPRSPKKKASKAAHSSQKDEDTSDHDPNGFANQVKQDEDFTRINRKIIVGPPNTYNRAAFVCWYTGEALTSGEIQRALTALGIKADTPGISRALKNNLGKFLTSEQRTSGGKPAKYKLTAPATAEFEKWFEADAK